MKNLKKIETPLEVESIKIVKNVVCLFVGVELLFNPYQLYETCVGCDYFCFDLKDGKCVFYEYPVKPIGKGDPAVWVIKCARCGSDIKFHGTSLGLSVGDQESCDKCYLLHSFLREADNKDSEIVFAIPAIDRPFWKKR